jgi:hypothetical protein
MIKTRSPKSQNQTAIASHHPQNPIAYFTIKQRSPTPPTQPDRLVLQLKQRSPPQHPQNPIACPLKSPNDRPSPPQTRSPKSQIKQRSPLSNHKPDRLFPHIKQRSPLNTQHPITYFPSNSDRLANLY